MFTVITTTYTIMHYPVFSFLVRATKIKMVIRVIQRIIKSLNDFNDFWLIDYHFYLLENVSKTIRSISNTSRKIEE